MSGRVAREGLALAIMSAACLRLDFNERNNGLTIRPRCFLPIRARSFPNTIENGYFAGQSPDVRAKGLAWIAEQIRAAGGNIEEAMERFSQETEKPTGFSEDELQVGDQVHFRNLASKEVGPESGKNLIYAGADTYIDPSTGARYTAQEVREEIRAWTTNGPQPSLDSIVIDNVRRVQLPESLRK